MAEEELVVVTSFVPSDCKRKFEDQHSDDGENKRPCLDDDNQNYLADTNRHDEKKVAEPEENAHSEEIQDVSKDNSEETAKPTNTKEILVEEPSKSIEQLDSSSNDPTFQHDTSSGQKQPISRSDTTTTQEIEVPSNKEFNLKDLLESIYEFENLMDAMFTEADAGDSPAREVPNEKEFNLNDFLESIDKAEKLLDAMSAEDDDGGSPAFVAQDLSPARAIMGSDHIQIQVPNEKFEIPQADAGGSPALVARGLSPAQAIVGSDQIQIQVPNEKLIPQHLPEANDSKERTVQVTADKRQIEIAQEMAKEALSQLIPQHLPEADDSKERTVQVTGDKRQIEIAQEMTKEALSQVKAVFVKNLPKNVTQEQLKKLFEHHGKITKVVLPPPKPGQEKNRIGFVHFAERSNAMKALKNTEKYVLDGQILECSLANPQTDQKAVVSNIQSQGLLPSYPPRVGYGLVGNPYGALGAGYGAPGLAQPLMYGPSQTPGGMAMMPRLLADRRIRYVLQQPGLQPHTPHTLHTPPSHQRGGMSGGGGGGRGSRGGWHINDSGPGLIYRPY